MFLTTNNDNEVIDTLIRIKNVINTAGSQLVSKNGRAKLVMQDDGNLVVYCVVGGEVLWNSESNGKGVDSGLKLQVSFIM